MGLDNIGVFDRSKPLPTRGYLEQADGTWMGMFCLNTLAIALEAREDLVYADIALKFLEHFLYIADAINRISSENMALWDEADGFYYDVDIPNDRERLIKVRLMVGLTLLFAVDILEPDLLEIVPRFKQQIDWFFSDRPIAKNVASMKIPITFFTVAAGFFEILLANRSAKEKSTWGLEAVTTMLLHGLGGVSILGAIAIMSVWRGMQRYQWRKDRARQVQWSYLLAGIVMLGVLFVHGTLGAHMEDEFGIHVTAVQLVREDKSPNLLLK